MKLPVRIAFSKHPRLAACPRIVGVVPIVACASSLVVFFSLAAQAEIPFEREPISYLTAPVHDPVALLEVRLQAGKIRLRSDGRQGYLRSVLEQLNVPISSQVLVFSKTSFQTDAHRT